MEDMEQRLIPYINDQTWPDFAFKEIKPLGVNGLQIGKYGGPGLSTLEAGSIMYEMAKIDGSVAMSFLVQNCLGMALVDALGDEEQRARILPSLMNFDCFISFGLTEVSGGSNASNPITNARKVEGGYILNGQKRWIGQGTYADFIVIWAKNVDEDNKVQGFVVQKGSQGLRTEKMMGKMACRMTQNADIYLKDVFVSDRNRLKYGTDF